MFHIINLSKSDPTPLYIQLALELTHLIQEGIMPAGMKLPTIRKLANDLLINRDTVVSAYKLLEHKGLIESYIGKGTYISHSSPLPSPTPTSDASYLNCSQLSLPKHFFPASLCLSLSQSVISKEGWEVFEDPHHRERYHLRQKVTTYLQQLGITAHFAQVRVTKSLDTFLGFLFKCSPKNGICVEQPRDLTVSCYLRDIGAKIYEVPLTEEGINLDVLEKHLKTGIISYIFVSPYLQNPTGLCYSEENKAGLIALAKQYDVYIIEDGTYTSFLVKPPVYMPLYSSYDKVIFITSFTKVYLPYLHAHFIVLPTSLIKRMPDFSNYSFEERLLTSYIASEEFKTIEAHIHETYFNHYKYLISHEKNMAFLQRFVLNSNPLWLWLKIPLGLYDAFSSYLLQKHILVAPGELFSNQPLPGYMRLSLANLSTDDIELLIDSIQSFT